MELRQAGTATADATSSHLHALRIAELDGVRPLFRSGARVLEIGGGDGFQASVLAQWGLEVTSIDIVASAPGAAFPVAAYDGQSLPFPDAHFDHVFTSNVLEHVPDVRGMLSETRRVLKPGGTAIHLVPSPSWRFWTSVAHYAYLVKYLVTGRHSIPTHARELPTVKAKLRSRGLWWVIKRALFPGAHGEYPSATAELWYYSARRWQREMRDAGFDVRSPRATGLFSTGYGIGAGALSLSARRVLGKVIGSCYVFEAKAR